METEVPEGLNVSSEMIIPSILELMGTGFEESSGLVFGQSNNGLLEGHYNPSDQLFQSNEIGEINGENVSDNKSPESDTFDGMVSGEDLDQPSLPHKKKRYHRHTQAQIDRMEAFFKDQPHPDDKQRKELGRELGLEPLQIKFWFQNKRTQTKAQLERHENNLLKEENEKLKADNLQYKEALNNVRCSACGGSATLGKLSFEGHQLMMENSQLKKELRRISEKVAENNGKPLLNLISVSPPLTPSNLQQTISGDLFGPVETLVPITRPEDQEKNKIMFAHLAIAAMEELVGMARMDAPLWFLNQEINTHFLNKDEYAKVFPLVVGPKNEGFKPEASRDTALVAMGCGDLVRLIMDEGQWSTAFSGIVSRTTTLEVLSTGKEGTYNGTLHMINAEFQVLSPLVPNRETCFLRYCKQHANGSWAVVDISLDDKWHLNNSSSVRYRRKPSGCLFEDMSNGYSKVTWVEHVEVGDDDVHHLYRPLLQSGLVFGAKRWISILERHCERLASIEEPNLLDVPNTQGRKGMLKLVERMMVTFHSGVSASAAHGWTSLPEANSHDVRIMIRKSVEEQGHPPGIELSVATSFWLPVPHVRVFDYLRDHGNRYQWDILSDGCAVEEIMHIPTGQNATNCASLLRVLGTYNEGANKMLILQESRSDTTGSFITYAPIDNEAIAAVLGGGDSNYVMLLPSGFAMLPDGPIGSEGSSGCLVTVAFQILLDSSSDAKLSMESITAVNNLIACTVRRIKESMVAH